MLVINWKIDFLKVQLKPVVNLTRPLLIRSKKLKRRQGTVVSGSLSQPPQPVAISTPPALNVISPVPKQSSVILAPSRPIFAATSGGFSGGSLPHHHQQQQPQQQQQSGLMKKRKADDSTGSVKMTTVKPVSIIPASTIVKQEEQLTTERGTMKKRKHRFNENGDKPIIMNTSSKTNTTNTSSAVNSTTTKSSTTAQLNDNRVICRIGDDAENRQNVSRVVSS